MIPNLPPSGSLVRFSRLPRASWAIAGETYRIRYALSVRAGRTGIHPSTAVHLWSEDRDCGTIGPARNFDVAQWEVVA